MKMRISLLLLAAFLPAPAAWGQNPDARIPDFTKGEKHSEKYDWNLGPTGLRGFIPGNRLETIDTRQMLVSSVDPGSPADGIIEVGDVIIGVDGEKFHSDVRRVYGKAITEAERKENGGLLKLLIWRKGKTLSKTLKLRVMGSYSDTSPVDCEKTQKIIDLAARYLRELYPTKKNRSGELQLGGIDIKMASLGLLATGKPEYMKEVRQCVEYTCAPERLKKVDINLQQGLCSWSWGYTNLFLTEYYLATGDKSVLPAIERYSNAIALGQSGVGTWGHRMAHPYWNYGRIHGRIHGYGALNQAGIICHLSLVLARQCGIKDKEVDQAVTKANEFFRFYVDKGGIPYGDHAPFTASHDVNGKNATAAIIFDLQGDDEATRFFARTATAAWREKEKGHTGNYFGFFWGPLGARRIGLAAEAAYLKELRWFNDMQRNWRGGFTYQGGLGPKAQHKYGGWDTTGGQLLALTAPAKRLFINGRGAKGSNIVSAKQAASLIEDGRGFTAWGNPKFARMSQARLREQLGSWSPTVRQYAAVALGEKESVDLAPLVRMLESGTRHQKLGAALALGELGERSAKAVPALMKTFDSNDLWLKSIAAGSLQKIGPSANKAIPVLMKAIVAPDPTDRREMLRRNLADALFSIRKKGPDGLLTANIDQVDKEILLEAVKILLQNPDGGTRSTTSSVFDILSVDEVKILMPSIVEAIKNASPSGVMFSQKVRANGLKLLAKYNIREGLELCTDLDGLEYFEGMNRHRVEALAAYGSAAKEYLPELKKLRDDIKARSDESRAKAVAAAKRNNRPIPKQRRNKLLGPLEKCIDAIENDKKAPRKLISLEEFLQS